MRTYFFICHISGRAAVLQLHLLALLLATVAIVVVNVSVVCTIAVAVAVIVTVMYPLWTHAMTVVIAIDSVDMTRRPITFLPHHRRPLSRPAVVVASLASASPCLQPVVVGRCLSFGAFAHSLDEVPVVLADLVILSWPELLACPPRVKFALFVAV